METPETTITKVLEQGDLEQFERLGTLYAQAKLLILYSEEIDPSARSNIQVIKELRDALDHVMRVVIARLCDDRPERAEEPEYCSKNLEKAFGHVYRAAFDALDGTVLSLREKIVQMLDGYPLAVIKDVIPDYWELRRDLDELTAKFALHRSEKDVGGDIGKTLNNYVSDTERIKNFYNKIVNAGNALDECQRIHSKETKDAEKKHVWTHIKGGLGYTAIGAFIVMILNLVGCDPKVYIKHVVNSYSAESPLPTKSAAEDQKPH